MENHSSYWDSICSLYRDKPKSIYTEEMHHVLVRHTLIYSNPKQSRLQRFFCRMSGEILFSHLATERDTPVLVPATKTNPLSIKYNAPKTQAAGCGIKSK